MYVGGKVKPNMYVRFACVYDYLYVSQSETEVHRKQRSCESVNEVKDWYTVCNM